MEWQPINIDLGKVNKTEVERKLTTEGLSASPEALHQNFLSDLSHLQEIHDSHKNVMDSNFSTIEGNFERIARVISTEAMLDRYDGKSNGNYISLPLHGCELSGIQINTSEFNGHEIVKLNVTSQNSEELEQLFNLPKGSRLASATWDCGELHLNLSRK